MQQRDTFLGGYPFWFPLSEGTQVPLRPDTTDDTVIFFLWKNDPVHHLGTVVDHLMQERGTDILDGTGKSSFSDVDLVGCSFLADPGIIPEREVAVCSGCALDRDGGS